MDLLVGGITPFSNVGQDGTGGTCTSSYNVCNSCFGNVSVGVCPTHVSVGCVLVNIN